MNNSKLIASYEMDSSHKVDLYSDRIELNRYGWSSFRYEDIKSAKLTNRIFMTFLNLELWNGKAEYIQISNKYSKECISQLEQFIRSSQASLDGIVGEYVRCTSLGGSGVMSLAPGNVCQVVFGKEAIFLVSGAKRIDIKFNQLTALKLEGPGRITTNAGVMGGGFGLEGALLGIGAAAILNTLTTNTSTNTVLYLAWPGSELFLHTSDYSPEEARLALSHVFTAIESVKNIGVLAVNNNGTSDIASQIERLVALRNSGVLTEDEFSLGKAKLLGSNG